jgi:hypothetical protein
LMAMPVLNSTPRPWAITPTAWKRMSFATLLEYTLEHLINAKNGNDQIRDILDGWCKEIRIRPVSEVLKPSRGVYDVHIRSGSRATVVSSPFRNPRISRTERKGINSMRF